MATPVQPMTFLGLCNALIQKCGISGNPLATTANQSGEMARVVMWINEAYLHIQELEPNWDWMTANVSFQTVAQQALYSPTAIGLTDFAAWDEDSFRFYFNSAGVRSEVYLTWLPWTTYRDTYLYGNLRLTYGTPIQISQQPSDHSLALGLIPDALGYTIDGQYYTTPSTLVADTDTPALPARFHMLIVYLAMISYGNYESAGEVLAEGTKQYASMLRRLMNNQLPAVEVGAPLC